MRFARALVAGALVTLVACGDLVAIQGYGLEPEPRPVASPTDPDPDASQHLTGLDASAADTATPPPQTADGSFAPPCSTEYGDDVELVIRNERTNGVWLTMLELPQKGCGESWYGYLEPGTERKVDTQEGRVWRARKDDGSLAGEYWIVYNAQGALVFEIK